MFRWIKRWWEKQLARWEAYLEHLDDMFDVFPEDEHYDEETLRRYRRERWNREQLKERHFTGKNPKL